MPEVELTTTKSALALNFSKTEFQPRTLGECELLLLRRLERGVELHHAALRCRERRRELGHFVLSVVLGPVQKILLDAM